MLAVFMVLFMWWDPMGRAFGVKSGFFATAAEIGEEQQSLFDRYLVQLPQGATNIFVWSGGRDPHFACSMYVSSNRELFQLAKSFSGVSLREFSQSKGAGNLFPFGGASAPSGTVIPFRSVEQRPDSKHGSSRSVLCLQTSVLRCEASSRNPRLPPTMIRQSHHTIIMIPGRLGPAVLVDIPTSLI